MTKTPWLYGKIIARKKMLEGYLATEKDLKAVEEGIKTVWHPKLRFVFGDTLKITNAIAISYDSKFVYLWSPHQVSGLDKLPSGLKKYSLYRIPHQLKLKNEWQYAWCAAIWDNQIEKLLPRKIRQSTRFQIPRISGGLLEPFITLQKKFKGGKLNPYTNYESYLATIIHEFGHVYWDQFKLWWYSDKKQNLAYLKLAEKLYQNERMVADISLTLPTNIGLGELFAFCTEYYASGLFWPRHRRSLDLFFKERIKELIKLEQKSI